jgi:hypothetical protein
MRLITSRQLPDPAAISWWVMWIGFSIFELFFFDLRLVQRNS